MGEEHAGEVRGLALHPSRKYAVSVSDDASWAWWDLNNAACLKQVRAADEKVLFVRCRDGGSEMCLSSDASWAWRDLAHTACLKQVRG